MYRYVQSQIVAVALLVGVFSLLPAEVRGQLELEPAFPNLSFGFPIELRSPNDGTNRVFVADRPEGKIYVFENDPGVTEKKVFLDISNLITGTGLLSFTVHPDYATNGYLYLFYLGVSDAPSAKSIFVSRFTASETNPDTVLPETQLDLIEVELPDPSGHTGGQVQFGPHDGYLYFCIGDGSNRGNDEYGYAQDLTVLFSKVSRIDVDNPVPPNNYGIPPDNPYVGNTQGYREEIYAYGFRNPWRFSFTTGDNRFLLGDVGVSEWEEVNLVEPGKNYGWSIVEGTSCFNPPKNCDTTGLTMPLYEFPHPKGGGSGVCGGYSYTGVAVPELTGLWIFGDVSNGKIWSLDYDGVNPPDVVELMDTDLYIMSFGTDSNGELYVVDLFGVNRFRSTVLAPPQLLEPIDGAAGISLAPTMIWEQAPGAELYALQVSDTADFSDLVVDEDSIASTSYDATGLSYNTIYYWRVNASDSTTTTPWSEVWSFATLPPPPDPVSLLSPPDGATVLSDSVRVSWSSSTPYIDRYWVEHGADSNFTASAIDSLVVDTTAVLHFLQHHTTYYWRVRAHNESGWGPFSSVRSFLVLTTAPQAPLLVSPPDGAGDQPLSVTLLWHQVSPALLRQMMDERRELSSPESEVQTIGESRGKNWEVPSLKGDDLVREAITPNLTATDTVWYHLQLATDPGFDTLIVDDFTLVDTTTVTGSLSVNTTYYWRVKARNLIGGSSWSEAWSFTTLTLPAQVVLASPMNGAVLDELSAICRWLPSSPQVDRYWFEWASDSAFTNSRIDSTGTDTISIASPLQNNQTYYWKVRAHNEAGWGELSEVWSFSVLIIGVEEEEQVPTAHSLSQNYPNPFNPATTIRYGLPERAHVRLEVFNMLGERVNLLKDGLGDAGYHTVVFEAERLPSGIYFYRLQAGGFGDTKKLILMR